MEKKNQKYNGVNNEDLEIEKLMNEIDRLLPIVIELEDKNLINFYKSIKRSAIGITCFSKDMIARNSETYDYLCYRVYWSLDRLKNCITIKPLDIRFNYNDIYTILKKYYKAELARNEAFLRNLGQETYIKDFNTFYPHYVTSAKLDEKIEFNLFLLKMDESRDLSIVHEKCAQDVLKEGIIPSSEILDLPAFSMSMEQFYDLFNCLTLVPKDENINLRRSYNRIIN